jgi:Tol biopolymer transport system component
VRFDPRRHRLCRQFVRAGRLGRRALVVLALSLVGAAILATHSAAESSTAPELAQKIAFVRDDGAGSAIYVMNSDGTAQRRLSSAGGQCREDSEPTWAPTGERVAFVRTVGCWDREETTLRSALYVVNADGRRLRRLTRPGEDVLGQLAWSPDGRLIAFTRSPQDLSLSRVYVVTNAGAERRLTRGLRSEDSPAWSPDGTRIALVRETSNGGEIVVITRDGTDINRVARDANLTYPTWSPDGRRVSFGRGNRARTGSYEVQVANSDGSGRRTLVRATAYRGLHAWSPNGDTIVYITQTAGVYDIYTTTSAGSGKRRLTHDSALERDPRWSPDGQRISFSSSVGRQNDIFVMNADGIDSRNLTSTAVSEDSPAWQPTPRTP